MSNEEVVSILWGFPCHHQTSRVIGNKVIDCRFKMEIFFTGQNLCGVRAIPNDFIFPDHKDKVIDAFYLLEWTLNFESFCFLPFKPVIFGMVSHAGVSPEQLFAIICGDTCEMVSDWQTDRNVGERTNSCFALGSLSIPNDNLSLIEQLKNGEGIWVEIKLGICE